MTTEPVADAHEAALNAARRRGMIAIACTAIVCVVVLFSLRSCIEPPPGPHACATSSDCPGVLGVECLHAPTSVYCTHACSADTDCEAGFHCDTPPWEQGATRRLCLHDVTPAK